MTLASLLLVDSPRDTIWELDWESLAGARTGLLSWITNEPMLDAGVPSPVAQLLARTFCRTGLVTYLCSQVPQTADAGWRTTPLGSTCRIRSTSIVQRQFFPLVATRKPDVAVQLFDDPSFSWNRRAQVVLISDPASLPPAVDWGMLDGITGRPIQTNADRLREAGVRILVLPGVDGDVAGFYFLDEVFGSALVSNLQAACEESGIFGEVLPEAEFRIRLGVGAPPQ